MSRAFGQVGPTEPHPVTLDHVNGGYICARCLEQIPDGCLVHAAIDKNKLSGVRVDTPDGETVHACGTLVNK
jgi:hypothetical protein